MAHPNTKKDNDLAVASIALGVLAVTGAGFFTGIPAIICGALALKNPASRGLSIAGLITGIVASVVSVLILIVFFLILLFVSSVPAHDSSEMSHPRIENGSGTQYQKV